MRRLIPPAEAALSWGTPPAELDPAENVANPLVDGSLAGGRGNHAIIRRVSFSSSSIPGTPSPLQVQARGPWLSVGAPCSLVGLAGCFVARFDRL